MPLNIYIYFILDIISYNGFIYNTTTASMNIALLDELSNILIHGPNHT